MSSLYLNSSLPNKILKIYCKYKGEINRLQTCGKHHHASSDKKTFVKQKGLRA